MSNSLSPELLAQLFSQESNDPYLILLTLSHETFDDIYLVNNTVEITSQGRTFIPFPFKLKPSVDDGESAREVTIEFDNVSLELIEEIRSVTSPIAVKVEMILASIPDDIQNTLEDMVIQGLTYNKTRIVARLILDNFLNSEMTSERYTPSNFPGLF